MAVILNLLHKIFCLSHFLVCICNWFSLFFFLFPRVCFKVFSFCVLSKLDHPGIMKLVAAHARPPNYMFFFELYEAGALSLKLHVEEYSLSIGQAMEITTLLGMCIDTSKNLNMLNAGC